MCGIVGILSSERPLPRGMIQAATDAIAHRGPDDEGYLLWNPGRGMLTAGGEDTPAAVWNADRPYLPGNRLDELPIESAQLLLGHRRLAILDLSAAGHQPMCDSSRRYWIIFNGEIYNYREIRATLEEHGHRFYSHCDTEVILAAYKQWGEECLHHFNGMWAFGIWDSERKELFLARDRFGIKPLYYTYDRARGVFAFASEIKALLSTGLVAPEANRGRVFDFLAYSLTDHTNDTLFKGIFQVDPGHFLKIDRARFEVRDKQYYDLAEYSAEDPSPRPWSKQLLETLESAVESHLVSDVPVGTTLSGGLDSSSVACVVNRLRFQSGREAGKQRTFTAIYGDARFDETPWVDDLVRQMHSAHQYISVRPDDLVLELSGIVRMQEEPFDKVGVVSQWQVFRAIRAAGVKVTLDGQGGDELFGGYHDYFTDHFDTITAEGGSFKRAVELGCYAYHHGRTKAERYLPDGAVARALKRKIVPSSPTGELPWISPEFEAEQVGHIASLPAPAQSWGRLNKRLFRSFARESIPHSLRLSDRNSMAHGVEARLPLLDYRLVELAFSMPGSEKIKFGQAKYVLRRAMKGILPESVRTRQDKLGFWLVLEEWFRSPAMVEFVRELTSSSSFQTRDMIVPANCAHNFELFLRTGHYGSFWRWINLELWMRELIDRRAANISDSPTTIGRIANLT